MAEKIAVVSYQVLQLLILRLTLPGCQLLHPDPGLGT